MLEKGHYVYMLKCHDGTFYIGYATEIARRVKEHNHSAKGAKYTRGRRPVTLVYYKMFESKSDALKAEYNLKRKTRLEKEEMAINFGNEN